MKRLLKEGLYRIKRKQTGFEVQDNLLKQTHFVTLENNRKIGPCTCSRSRHAQRGTRNAPCPHQSLIRRHIFDTWWKRIEGPEKRRS